MEFLKNNRHRIALCAFLLLHILTLFTVPLFGDDYYYAAFLKNGADYFVSENINHYLHTNGRALVHLLDELLIGFGMLPWRLASAAVMAALIIVLAKLAARTYRPDHDSGQYKNAVIAVCAIFSLTSIHILRESVYWATGSLNYMFPAALTLWFVYFMRRDLEQERGSYLLAIPAFFVSLTVEQASAAALLAVIWLIATALIRRKKRLLPAYFVIFGASFAGFALLMLAPGNAERSSMYPEFYAELLIPRTLGNLKGLTAVMFGSGGLWTVILLSFLLLFIKSVRRAGTRRIAWIPAVLSFAAAVLYAIGLTLYEPLLTAVWFLPIFTAPIVILLIFPIIAYFRDGETDNVYFVLGAALMQAAMALSPVYGPRTLFISLVMLIVPLARGFLEELEVKPLPVHKAAAIGAALAILFYLHLPIGYFSNFAVHRFNREQLESAVAGEPLTLRMPENRLYGYTMAHDDPYHAGMLLRLYGLPFDTEIRYQ